MRCTLGLGLLARLAGRASSHAERVQKTDA